MYSVLLSLNKRITDAPTLPTKRRAQEAHPPPRVPPGSGRPPARFLDVSLLVASEGWLDPRLGKHLQEACWTLCRDCREHVGSHLRVGDSTPRVLWPLRPITTVGSRSRVLGDCGDGRCRESDDGSATITLDLSVRFAVTPALSQSDGDVSRRSLACQLNSRSASNNSDNKCLSDGSGDLSTSIPPLRVSAMTWKRSLDDLARGLALPEGLEAVFFVCNFRDYDVGWVVWPSSLLSISFGNGFNQPIAAVSWPAGLQRLTFGWEVLLQPLFACGVFLLGTFIHENICIASWCLIGRIRAYIWFVTYLQFLLFPNCCIPSQHILGTN